MIIQESFAEIDLNLKYDEFAPKKWVSADIITDYYHVQNYPYASNFILDNPNSLRLFSMVAQEWFSANQQLRTRKLPTYFGIVDLEYVVNKTADKGQIRFHLYRSDNNLQESLRYIFIYWRDPAFLSLKTHQEFSLGSEENNLENASIETTVKQFCIIIPVPIEFQCITDLFLTGNIFVEPD